VRADVAFAITALGIERFRQDHHRLPDSLAELTPNFLDAVPMDPFDGKSIRYKTTPTGFILYSADADGREDNGQTRPPKKSGRSVTTYDLVFRAER
jgi:hypothetical protein